MRRASKVLYRWVPAGALVTAVPGVCVAYDGPPSPDTKSPTNRTGTAMRTAPSAPRGNASGMRACGGAITGTRAGSGYQGSSGVAVVRYL
ncbi:hypothetical protein KQH49_14365 [Mycetohabitans sp. B5]|uniref:Secreted protein n=1 Tax=Mycetohabitans endofungorum TaxID=417203 RepID=A0A2P5K785_9BURK|nr:MULTISPECIES: hypothetical protein [Mycetohabitans]MCG1056037.1 hypothetical protein [Mycetohabitans sp. B5]PPB81928.1 hypothetical protein B0O95_11714 [Mycetohabitans endofungorum]